MSQPQSQPQEPPPSQSPPRKSGWPRAVSVALQGLLAVFAAALIAGIVIAALRAQPSGPTFGWPFRLTGRTNVLIMGLDRTVSDQNPKIVYTTSRTDALIAAGFDPNGRQIHVLSIPRDTRAPIPGHGTGKINAAYAIGKETLTRRTVENFTGVVFPYYVTIRERGYVHLIDAVGGVTVRIDKDLNYDDNWDGLHIHLKKGNRRLGGKAAIEYARFRHDALGDIGRIKRQQQVLDALITELRRPQVVFRAGRILRVFREDIDTNLTPEQLIALGWFTARLPKNALDRETLPGRFGAADWLPTPADDRVTIARMFYGLDAAVLAQTSVDVVVSGAGRAAAGDALTRLDALGVRVRVRSAPDAATSAVIRHGADPAIAAIIAAVTRIDQIAADSAIPAAAGGGSEPGTPTAVGAQAGGGTDAGVTVILGRDYDGRVAPPFTR